MTYKRILYVNMFAIFFFVHVIPNSNGFPPQPITGPYRKTKSHRDITHKAFYLAASKVLVDNGYVNSVGETTISDYFGSDNDGKKKFENAIREVIQNMNKFQRRMKTVAKINVNGEQIKEANSYVLRQRKKMKRRISRGKKGKKVKSYLRKLTGQCLFVIQSFYSNTNWVEMNGDDFYPDFGIKKKLMRVASSKTATCRDCDQDNIHSNNSCKSSLLVSNMLTSGYRSGQDIHKPNLVGKCSHGGKNDPDSRVVPAVGGINKETLDFSQSPRADLHLLAADAAVNATVHFLIGKGGVLSDSGNDTFMWIFDLKRRKPNLSLAFIIDVSGSMEKDIKKAIAVCTNKVTAVQNTANEPDNYVLVTFNDPADQTVGKKTKDYREMLTFLKQLVADGGDDCPEYSMSGILKGIELSNNGSTLMVFTDADAKDCKLSSEVARKSIEKKMKIDFILTGSCGSSPCSRKKRDIGSRSISRKRSKRDVSDIYKQLAQATGGHVYETDRDQMDAIIEKILEETFPSSKVLIQAFSNPSENEDMMSIHVDDDVQLLKVEIVGATEQTQADAIDPSGRKVNYGDSTSSRFYSSNKIIISVQKPTSGIWNLVRNVKRNWAVTVSAEASLDIKVQLLETDENGYSLEIDGNPLAGKNYTMYVMVNNPFPNITCKSINFLRENGSEIFSIGTALETLDSECFVRIDNCALPENAFRVQLTGTDGNGNIFMRTYWKTFTPVTVNLELIEITDSLQTEVPHKLSYIIANSGSDNETFAVNLSDEDKVVNSNAHVLNSGQSTKGFFHITGWSDSEIRTYVLSVNQYGTSTVLQSLSETITFTSVSHPKCNLSSVEGNCTISVACNMANWSASAQINYSGVKVENIYLTNADDSVVLEHDNITAGKSPIQVYVEGTCCFPSVFINVQDEDHYTGRCHINLGNPYTLLQPKLPLTTPPAEWTTGAWDKVETTMAEDLSQKNPSNVENAVIISVTICLLIVMLLAIVGLINYRHRCRRNQHI